ncbi:Gfo/Idh/MocA family protein [Bosea sp. PAMC 26642]|uniref:Gfo/Idh/MocA family protein n=1 Tax=Bosea sp. (strain PAMC 26642) TaxID=1792307 RepID=UPI00143C05FF|nr:Gfo/Idh/MocA family oxidoreductase [Bosea sp. PAMC 26642]
MTQHHLRAWQTLAGRAEVVAIADPSAPAREARAEAFAIPKTYADAAAMLSAERLDAVDIAAPRAVHADLVRLAAAHGVACLCQKPLAPTYDKARDLVTEIDGRIRLMVHENWRFRAWYREIAGWLAAGRIGAPFAARLSFVTSGTLPDLDGRYPALERQPFMRGEVRMLVSEVLIHQIDTLRMLLGPLEVVACTMNRICTALVGEDTAIIQMQGRNGLGIQIFATFAAHGHPAVAADRLEILGPKGSIRLDGGALSLAGADATTQSFDPDATYQGSYDATIAHFVDRLDDGQPFETAPEDNLQTLRLVEDCYRLAGRLEAR